VRDQVSNPYRREGKLT